MNNKQLQQMFSGDQQGYLYADALRIMTNGNKELLTDEHIDAIRVENRQGFEVASEIQNLMVAI